MKRMLVVAATVASAMVLATSAQAATVHQWTVPGRAFINPKDLQPRDLVNGKLVTNVVLPSDYSSRSCWPVLYLLHGTADSSNPVSLQWLQIDDGELLKMHIPAIVVVPGSGDSWWVNNWYHGYRHPGFEDWVLQDIVPLVQHRLHVCPGRDEHAIAGLSMGGYGAIYLASQLPGYFGSAGSFSGVLSPESPNFLTIFPEFPTYWGPADHFYAVGHDPIALVNNLRHTRVFVASGDGVPSTGEVPNPVAEFEEAEFDQESVAYVAHAKAAHVNAQFDQLPGEHTDQTWIDGLTHMLAWKPFRPVVEQPKNWTFSTVDTTGTAWGYRFAFSKYHPPATIIRFSMHNGTLAVRGEGRVTITPPSSKPVTARIPFDLRHGKLVKIAHAPLPTLVGGYRKITPVTVTAKPNPVSVTGPISLSFTTKQTLPAGEEYQVGITSTGSTEPGCTDTVLKRIGSVPAGQTVTVTLTPPATATTPGQWCPGNAGLGVTEVARSAPATFLGTLLGISGVTIQ